MHGTTDIVVIGAGMVGVSAALQLVMRGRRVLLVDRSPPGNETTYGNAGVVVGSANFQVAVPRNLRELTRLALNRTTYFRYNPAVLPGMVPWLWGLWRGSSAHRLSQVARSAQALFSNAVSEHIHLARCARASGMLRETGWLHATRRNDGLAALARDRRLAEELGVRHDVLSAVDIADLEPSLKPVFSAGICWKGVYHTSEPSQLAKAYAKAFVAAGGKIHEALVQGLQLSGGEEWIVETTVQPIKAKELVIAAGPWSRDLLKRLGYRLPLAFKRGYHQHFAAAGNAQLRRPVKDSDYGFVLAPMAQGIRLTTGVELDLDEAPPSFAQLNKVLPRAREIFPLAEPTAGKLWLGRRPTFPDQLPMIGPAPRHRGLWFNFGHAHWGLALGPASGRLLAEMMCNGSVSVDPKPFSPGRSFKQEPSPPSAALGRQVGG